MRMFSNAWCATAPMRCSARPCACSAGRERRRNAAAASAVTRMTSEHAGARRHESQKSTRTAPAASRNARRPRSREQLLCCVVLCCRSCALVGRCSLCSLQATSPLPTRPFLRRSLPPACRLAKKSLPRSAPPNRSREDKAADRVELDRQQPLQLARAVPVEELDLLHEQRPEELHAQRREDLLA